MMTIDTQTLDKMRLTGGIIREALARLIQQELDVGDETPSALALRFVECGLARQQITPVSVTFSMYAAEGKGVSPYDALRNWVEVALQMQGKRP